MTIETILQIALVVASIGLAIFCTVLSRRLRRLNDLETGLGGAIAMMVAEIDRLEKSIIAARDEAKSAGEGLSAEVARSRNERAHWDLRRKIVDAAAPAAPASARRLRKRAEPTNA